MSKKHDHRKAMRRKQAVAKHRNQPAHKTPRQTKATAPSLIRAFQDVFVPPVFPVEPIFPKK